MVIDLFVDPRNKCILQKDSNGDLFYNSLNVTHIYKAYDGIIDFVQDSGELRKEREYYDNIYSIGQSGELTTEFIKEYWYIDIYPWRKTLLDSLGEIRGKKILLVGNGDSHKEFYFLTLGASVVVTDLSLECVKLMQKKFAASNLYEAYKEKIEFHAMDALNLPFQDGEFDVIYGSAFVHHVEDINSFLLEVYRCLKKGGICRFIDEADSPLWRGLKGTIFYPFKLYSHWRQPRSPADLVAESRGGYTYKDLNSIIERCGFHDLLFLREWFFLRIITRHYGKLTNYSQKAMRRANKLFLAMKWLDENISHINYFQRNQLMLIWGCKK